jgi:hypothetical protein
MGRRAVNHHGIRGSAALATQPIAPAAVPAEALEAGEMLRLPFAGELLGAARVRSGFVPIPVDAFDEAAPALAAEAQAAYLHLLRLSFGEGRNWCRATQRELKRRLRLSERRLLRVLDGLVARRLARPLHRDNRGTLWRVYLPREAAGAPVGHEVLLGRATDPAGGVLGSRSGARWRAGAGSSACTDARGTCPPSQGPLAHALADARGERGPEALERAGREIAELIAEGQTVRRIAAGIEALRRRRPPSSQESTP